MSKFVIVTVDPDFSELREEEGHVVGDPNCKECCWRCVDNYPRLCECGGVIHLAHEYVDDYDGGVVTLDFRRCDKCLKYYDGYDEQRKKLGASE